MLQQSITSALTLLLAAAPMTAWAAMYGSKDSRLLQVNAKSYKKLIHDSNHTSIVKFYAPWCGHCQNLKPAYVEAAGKLHGYAKVAVIDCDAEHNKNFCSSKGIKGFPTLKIVRPRANDPGNPIVEDYNGARTAGAMVKAVKSMINNHVTRLTDKDLDNFFKKDSRPKAIFFTQSGTTSPLLRSIAIDFLDVISIAQIRSKESGAVARFNINEFPTLILLPNGDPDAPVVYQGKLDKDNREAIVKFLRQAGEPNPDTLAAVKAKSGDKKAKTKDSRVKKEAKKPDTESATQEHTQETKTSSEATAAATPSVSTITTASSKQQVAELCLQPKSHTCILAFIPDSETHESKNVLESLSQLNTKYIQGGRHVFSFFAVPHSLEHLSFIRDKLEAKREVELVAINARRGWWRRYEGAFDSVNVEAWADAIRMGDGTKMKLPRGIVEDSEATQPEDSKVEEPTTEDTEAEKPKMEETETEETAKEKPEAEKAAPEEHDEL